MALFVGGLKSVTDSYWCLTGSNPCAFQLLSGQENAHKVERNLQWNLNGGGPQGSLLGKIEYRAQNNDSAHMVHVDDRFKSMDDLTAWEIVNFLVTEIKTDELRAHVPSDTPVHNKIVEKDKLES